MMVIERFYFSAGGHIKTIFLKKTLDRSIKIEGFALKMMTFFKEAFQVNRKSYPERVRSALFHAIKKTAANLDACVKVPGKDFSRKRKLPLQTMLLMLIGMISNLQLPNSEEFDVDTTLTLTRRQTKETLALLSAYPERYRWIQPHTTFDYIAPKDSAMYDLRFRVVRFRISGGCYETVYTNLDSETFPIGTIKELYRLRWGIETSFRELKYTIGLSCLHGKKTDFLLQEVFARLILYNYASLIARKIPVPQEKQINFSVAILVCKQFLKGKIRPAQIFEILSKYLSPIRPGRQYRRYQNPVSAVAFQYRFS